VQNFIKLSAAVRELSCYQRGKKNNKKAETILPSVPRAVTIKSVCDL